MKSKTNLDHIMQIISSTEIINAHSFSIDGKQYNAQHKSPYSEWPYQSKTFGSNPGVADHQLNQLKGRLSDTIYTQFYSIGGSENQEKKINPEIIPGYLQRQQEFIAALTEANQNTVDLDPYWTVTGFEKDQAIIQKNEYVKLLKPGLYMMAEGHQALEVGAQVHLKEPLEDATIQPVFFYIFGKATLQDGIESLRFYFNMTAEGASHLIFHLSNILNSYLIPFTFKCLNEAGWYSRADNAVLYVDKRFHHIIIDVLQLVYNEIYPWINDTTPLFTQKLAPGFGFAEDPGYGLSFGVTRCKIITELILDNARKGKKLNRKQVKDAFLKQGFDVEQLHLNPFSTMRYSYYINQPEV